MSRNETQEESLHQEFHQTRLNLFFYDAEQSSGRCIPFMIFLKLHLFEILNGKKNIKKLMKMHLLFREVLLFEHFERILRFWKPLSLDFVLCLQMRLVLVLLKPAEVRRHFSQKLLLY